MLLHEALARSRQREAEEAARRYRLARRARAANGHQWLRPAAVLLARTTRTRAVAARRAACAEAAVARSRTTA